MFTDIAKPKYSLRCPQPPLLVTPEISEAIHLRARKLMNTPEVFYNLVTAPLCVAETVWEMTETVTDITVRLRVDPLKKVTRMMKQYREEFSYTFRSKVNISRDQTKVIRAWAENFMDSTSGDSGMYSRIKAETERLYPDIDVEWRIMINAAYLAWIYAKAVIIHTEREEHDFAAKVGLPKVGHILPPHFYGLPPLLEAVFCETRLPDEFIKPLLHEVVQFIKDLAMDGSEKKERTSYRTRCIAYVCNGGCRAQALEGDRFGCYATSQCKRMMKYDKRTKHADIQSS